MDRISMRCKQAFIQDNTLVTQPNEAYTPQQLVLMMRRNQKLPSLKCNFDKDSSFDDYGHEDDDTIDNMSDEPEPPRDLTDLDIASRIVKDFNKEIEDAHKKSKPKKEEIPPKIEETPQ